MFSDLRERRERRKESEGQREKNINVRQKYQLVASCMLPNWGSNQQARYVL